MKNINIVVACGSGIATSTLAAEEVKSVCEEYGITNYTIKKSSMPEIDKVSKDADIVLTTNNYKGTLEMPSLNISSFITGINEAKLRVTLGETLVKLMNEKGEKEN